MDSFTHFRHHYVLRPVWIFALLCFLNGCSTWSNIQDIGSTPPMTRPQDPTAYAGYRPVEMPMPLSPQEKYQPNSLWRRGARDFFKDQRASRIGDVVTVNVRFADKASLVSTGNVSRKSTYKTGIPNFFGLESVLPQAITPGALVNSQSQPSQQSAGTVKRAEAAEFQMAALVTQVLKNGTLVISGRQEFRFNNEIRELLIAGVVRPEDILADNTISHEKIAEARISYGGRGQISDAQRVPPGQQLLNLISPF